MDAFAVSICKGLTCAKSGWVKGGITAGLYFGGFQALMPFAGYFLGKGLATFIDKVDHWVAFILLTLIGLGMIRDARKGEKELDGSFSPRSMLPLAVATSIDALAVGVTFAFLGVSIVPAVSLIGITTFCFSFAGVGIGSVFGSKFREKAQWAGGIILILIGTRILIEHLFF